ncbi:carbon-nitrogen hydrolase family protein [Pseudonocardia nigra]|uniref:carbon-nitrogen hydrolase family protein n=1 Tax=Pseudonocardia nigra TaxID=1921578 RepID=UPI001C5F7E97|nr:carbon-nitrogen hydrolase family protein [Pseudonocardia nigra]
MSRPLPLALVQAAGRRADDLKGFAAHVEHVARSHPQARLLVYPELHLATDDLGSLDEDAVVDSAEPVRDGPRHTLLSRLAADLGIWLCPGSVSELGDDGRVYNTALVYSPQGELAATYRKVFPWRPYERCTPGSTFVVFDMTGYGRAGLSICYDAWFPESTRHLAWMGAEIVLNVVKTPTADREQETVITRANAIVNQVFVASVNAATPSGMGRSLLVDPEGRVLVESPGALASVLTAVVDLDAVPTVRRFGTAGLSRMWEQLRPDDAPIALPLYGGRMDPRTRAITDR